MLDKIDFYCMVCKSCANNSVQKKSFITSEIAAINSYNNPQKVIDVSPVNNSTKNSDLLIISMK